MEFYVGVLGMRLSDSVESEFSLRFLHCPGRAARHHYGGTGGDARAWSASTI